MNEWQPIETASKTGAAIVMAEGAYVAAYSKRHKAWELIASLGPTGDTIVPGMFIEPTHWLPLPEPPQS